MLVRSVIRSMGAPLGRPTASTVVAAIAVPRTVALPAQRLPRPATTSTAVRWMSNGLIPQRATEKARTLLESGKAVNVAELEPEVKDALVYTTMPYLLYHSFIRPSCFYWSSITYMVYDVCDEIVGTNV
jgi:hypothetical protein